MEKSNDVRLHTVESGSRIAISEELGDEWIATDLWGKDGQRYICNARTGNMWLKRGNDRVVLRHAEASGNAPADQETNSHPQ